LESDSDLLFNRIVIAGDDHSEVTAEDASSQTAFRVRTLDRTSLVDNDVDAQTLADVLLSRFKDPELRFSEVEVQVASQSSARQAELLALELWDVVDVTRNPPGDGTPTSVDQVGRIDSLGWQWRPGNRVTLTVRMSAGSKQIFFVLDSDEFGELDDDKLA
jgi:hypothetical protein